MPDLADGETTEVQGSAKDPYVLRNTGGVYSCTCPAWRNQSIAIEKRTCKHLRKLRGDAAETERVGAALPAKPKPKPRLNAAVPAGGAAPAEGDEDAAAGPPLLLAHPWTDDVDLTGWWMSEKLDGVRAYWDGTQFISRQGNLFHVPDWFIADLPKVPLDGELWLDRKAFQRTISIVRRQDKSDHWKNIRYVVFDAPAVEEQFEARMAYLHELLTEHQAEFARAHEHVRCKGLAHLKEEMSRLETLGGEGLMVRQPGSLYVAGRSATLLKVKTFYDAEARVLEHLPGAGRHKGRLGALQVELADGTMFSVGTGFSDAERQNPPAVGTIITFRYQELSDRGVPRFPSYVGERRDVTEPSLLTGATARPAGVQASAASTSVSKAAPAQASPAKAPPAKVAKAKPPADDDDEGDDAEAEEAAEAHSAGIAAAPGVKRYFEFSDEKSNKFWEVATAGNDVTVRWGKIGADGQSKTKSFGSPQAAAAYAAELIEEKTEKGYEEAGK